MKKMIICGMLSLSILFTSCLGSFAAFNNLKDWNQEISDSKFVNNLVFWALNIVPVYGLFFIGDTLIFNVLEFWTGDNPIAMKEGETQEQMVQRGDDLLKVTASRNTMHLEVVDGPRKGEELQLVYTPDNKSWNAVKDGELIKLASMKEGFYMVYMPNGSEVKIPAHATQEEGLALLKEYRDCYEMEGMLAEAK